MTGHLFIQTEGLQTFSQTHAGVAQALPQSAADLAAGAVEGSHGPIAMAANTALNAALGSRGGAVQATTNSADKISELLQQAARAYERGDIRSAEELRAAADAMAGQSEAAGGGGASGAAGAGAGGTGGALGGGGAGGDQMGQMLGQIGGQVGQLAGMAMAPLAGLATLPQMAMQGVQQAVQAATQAASTSTGADAVGLENAALADDATLAEDSDADKNEEDRPDDEAAAGASAERAPAGADTVTGEQVAPDPAAPPAPEAGHTERAQTRPPLL